MKTVDRGTSHGRYTSPTGHQGRGSPCSRHHRSMDPFPPAPAVAAQSCGHLLCAVPDGPGHILPLVGANAGIHLIDFPSTFLKAGFRGAEQLGILPQQESRAELSHKDRSHMCVNS